MQTFSWHRYPNLTIDYDPDLVLPPDEASVDLGMRASMGLDQLQDLSGNPDLPVRLLDVGVGCGVIAASVLYSFRRAGNIQIVGFDKDPAAVELAQKNLARIADQWNIPGASVHTFVGDWNDPGLWERLATDYPGG